MPHRDDRRARRKTGQDRAGAAGGFTLIEVVVALALAGIILLGARRILEGLADSASQINRSAEAADADANGERTLRSLAGRLEVGTREAHEFSGTETEARFTSWCDVPDGWQERCDVRITIDSIAGAPALTLTLSIAAGSRAEAAAGLQPLVLRRGFRSGALRYLNRPDGGGVWFIAWGRGITTPLALGVVLERDTRAGALPASDTLIIRFGEGG